MICCLLVLSIATVLPASPAVAQIDLGKVLDTLFPPPTPPLAPPPAPPPPAPPQPAPLPPAPGRAPVIAPVPGPDVFPIPVPAIRRSPPKNTNLLIERLQPLIRTGVPLQQAMLRVVAPFPVAGPSKFSHDWGFPRYTPVPHLHEGTDIFADFGTPIVTSESGRILQKGTAGAGGISVWVRGDSGMAYYYAHLQSWAGNLQVGQRVERGTIIGYVGDTGNAEGGAPHLHFETHPGGGPGTPARDPKPFLDDALRQAEERALALVRAGRASAVIPPGATTTIFPRAQITKRVDKLLAAAAAIENPGDLMWFSVLEPTLGVIGLARQSTVAAGAPSARVTVREAEEVARMEEVRKAVLAPRVKFVNFAGKPVFSEELLNVTGPFEQSFDPRSDAYSGIAE